MNRTLAVLASCALAVLPSARALACSRVPCDDSSVFPAAGSVPANMVKLLFTPGRSYPPLDGGGPVARLVRLRGDTRESVPFHSTALTGRSQWITPAEPQPPGTRLVIEADPAGCSHTPLHAELTVAEAAPLPTTLGGLTAELARKVLTVAVVNGSCNAPVDAAYADLTVQLSDSAAPYAALFRYRLIVDDRERAPFASTLGGGALPQARVFAVCKKAPRVETDGTDLSVSRHRVRMEGQLPDGTKLRTDELEVELRCDGTDPAPADADATRPAREDSCALGGRDAGGWLLALALFAVRRRKR